MPQFDKITFFNQIFYFTIIFFSFYLLVLKILLPKIAFILKARKKKTVIFDFDANTFCRQQHHIFGPSLNVSNKQITILCLNHVKGDKKIWAHFRN